MLTSSIFPDSEDGRETPGSLFHLPELTLISCHIDEVILLLLIERGRLNNDGLVGTKVKCHGACRTIPIFQCEFHRRHLPDSCRCPNVSQILPSDRLACTNIKWTVLIDIAEHRFTVQVSHCRVVCCYA